MTEAESERSGFGDSQDAEVTQYQMISGLAVTGLLLAFLAPVAVFHPTLWIVPAVGIVVSLIALKRIAAAAPAMIGRKAAVFALVLSVLSAAVACSQWAAYRALIDGEARRYAEHWFAYLRNGEPHKAYQMAEYPENRLALDENLWEYYAEGTDGRRDLESYLRREEVESLLALGDQALVRYYDTETIYRDHGNDLVVQVYAVTSEREGEKRSYFLRMTMRRHSMPETGRTYWQIAGFAGGIRPEAMGGEQGSWGG